MGKKEIIEEMFFDKGMTLTKISEEVNLSVSYISRILKENEQYASENERRKKETKEKWKVKRRELMRLDRKENAMRRIIENQVMKNMHENAAREMSKRKVLGNDMLLKWCSMYKYNKKKKCYEFDTERALKPNDFPLYIKV